MMQVLHRGFDGLDVSFQGQISADLFRGLDAAKQKAQRFQQQTVLTWNGVQMLVSESGSRGGYAFVASTGQFGATWFFKKPNDHDPWGVRVSCSSFNLALNGLGASRACLYQTLHDLGITVPNGAESISRVDYAIDFLAPELVLIPEHFVMHSNANRADHREPPEVRTNGTSGRVTSVTIGKMPGRQVIVYDKRAEVIARHKVGWWEIWDANRLAAGYGPLNRKMPSESRAWRVELRAGKRHLKDRWGIVSWDDLDSRLGDVFLAMLQAIRYAEPNGDTNRARWPASDLWEQVKHQTRTDLFEMRTCANPNLVKLVQQEEYDRLLSGQMLGLLTSRAAVAGISMVELVQFARRIGIEMADEIAQDHAKFAKKLVRAAARLAVAR